jgi:diguanylate cyclase (GGDEF)-like protein
MSALPLLTPDVGFASAQTAARPRLLIVDDVSDNRAILTRRFRRQGFDTVEAESGPEALALIAAQSFDAVLLDVMMPEMDGLEVLTRIRAQYAPTVLPVIMVTAKTQSEDVVQALTQGANDYVTKPVDFAIALARVNVQIERKKAEDAVARTNAALRNINEELEHRVSQRTAILAATNDQLRNEIAQREASEARSHYLAYHDPLTGLANRLLFREKLDGALAAQRGNGHAFAVLFVDLDGFKNVNDTLGHSLGDRLLRAVAGRLRDVIAQADYIARLGGDEFAILQLVGEQPSAATELAGRIIEEASHPYLIDEHDLMIGASVGIAICEPGDCDPEKLLKSADLAMYRAKDEGRGTYRIFDPTMEATAQARRAMELELRHALMNGAFQLYYQPLVNVRTSQITGFEALMRWDHPERGMIPPSEFIPVAEEMGLIVPLGEWALRQACAQAVTWPSDIRVAVNLSSVQFMRGSLVPAVLSALAMSGLPSHRLELEITETVLLDNSERNMKTLSQLRALGVRISMDDFGTGYSSLSYLRNFNFDKIKIDQSFIRDISNNRESRAIVKAIAGIGTTFGIVTTAEGVETEEQLRCLDIDGCTEVQGKFFSMPVPTDGIPAILRSLGQA